MKPLESLMRCLMMICLSALLGTACGDDDAKHAEDSIDADEREGSAIEAAKEDQELSGEAAGRGQSQRRQPGNAEDNSDNRHLPRQSPEHRDAALMGLFHNQAAHGEEQPGDDAVAEHLQGGTGHAHLTQGEDA